MNVVVRKEIKEYYNKMKGKEILAGVKIRKVLGHCVAYSLPLFFLSVRLKGYS